MKMEMKAKYLLWLLLFSAVGYAQIEVVPGSATGCGTTTGSCNTPVGVLSIAVGDTIIVNVSSASTATTASISGCLSSWPAVSTNASAVRQSKWIVLHSTEAVTGCQITISNMTGASAVSVVIYRGVLSMGTVSQKTTSTANQTNIITPSLTSTGAGNTVVGMFAIGHNATSTPATAISGTTIRRTSGSSVLSIIADTTTTTAAESITLGVVTNVAVQNNLTAAVELTPAPTNRDAVQTDAMQTILMRPPRSMNYVLPPASTLTPTWCTWFMPSGSAANDYELEPTTTHINGQISNIKIPSWQMTRICKDVNGDYWASPPLLAGNGITISPAPTGLTISASGTPGTSGMTYINGGVASIPGTVAVGADSCETIHTTSPANGVVQTDVVSWSYQPAPSGWANGRFYLRPEAHAGSIAWRGCNSGTTSYTPTARDINWYVARPTQ